MKPSVLIQLPTEPSYWGSETEPSDVDRILDNMETMLRSEFGSRFEICFERTPTPRGSGIHGLTDEDRDDVFDFIADNWLSAL